MPSRELSVLLRSKMLTIEADKLKLMIIKKSKTWSLAKEKVYYWAC